MPFEFSALKAAKIYTNCNPDSKIGVRCPDKWVLEAKQNENIKN